MAVRWNSGTYTVTFLKNVGLTETYTFEENRSDVVFDLAGHAIRGCVENGPVLVMDYGYGTDYISIQNGTIESTTTGGVALQLCTGKTTLKNVNVTGDTILTCQFVTGSPTTGELISAENIQYIIKAHYADTSGNLDPNAAEEKNVNGEITLTDPNYVFYDSHSEGREFTFGMGGKIHQGPRSHCAGRRADRCQWSCGRVRL